jgi:Pyruvate/2-oxoacid:ferredoxin oxidoreductase gamma subunit
MTPKSLLRHPRCVSSLTELAEGRFREVLEDASADPARVRRVVLTSGKLYYDLLKAREDGRADHVSLVRLEQLYPFPAAELARVLARYPVDVELLWAQEEPRNMGAWRFCASSSLDRIIRDPGRVPRRGPSRARPRSGLQGPREGAGPLAPGAGGGEARRSASRGGGAGAPQTPLAARVNPFARWCCHGGGGWRVAGGILALASSRRWRRALSAEVTVSWQRSNTAPEGNARQAVIRAGDSGDGMQITGDSSRTQRRGRQRHRDVSDFPAEIRAPAGTLPWVSGFQINFSSRDVYTPGDTVDVLVAMNPAALATNIADLKPGGILIVNVDNFEEVDLKKAQAKTNPLEDHSLDGYRLFPVELTKLTRLALRDLGLDAKSADRCKNFFALGMCYWLYNRPMDHTYKWLDEKFQGKPVLAEANKLAMKAGYAYCDATESFQVRYEVPAAKLEPGVYRNISGNTALAIGFVAAARKAGIMLFQGSYPIAPPPTSCTSSACTRSSA